MADTEPIANQHNEKEGCMINSQPLLFQQIWTILPNC